MTIVAVDNNYERSYARDSKQNKNLASSYAVGFGSVEYVKCAHNALLISCFISLIQLISLEVGTPTSERVLLRSKRWATGYRNGSRRPSLRDIPRHVNAHFNRDHHASVPRRVHVLEPPSSSCLLSPRTFLHYLHAISLCFIHELNSK